MIEKGKLKRRGNKNATRSAGGAKKGQVAVFVVIAILLIAGVVAYFIVKGQVAPSNVSPEFQPIYNAYEQCINEQLGKAINLAGSQGGRVYAGNYEMGSNYAPFGNQLNFLGFPVPYWYYMTGNGLIKQNVPTKTEIESDLAKYVQENLESCNFDSFYSQGYEINYSKPVVTVSIASNKVSIDVKNQLGASRGGASALKSDFTSSVNSRFGEFYAKAQELYADELKNAFLENYAVDIMNLNAPVDGVDLGCSGKIWKTRDVMNDIKSALETNINSLKVSGGYYSTNSSERNYFVIKTTSLGAGESASMLYSKSWPSKIEITGADDELMIAKPVGNQPGMGIMGFCYSPYHFVYDIFFPVMMQIYDNNELFQFPVVVIVDNNLPRQGIFSQLQQDEVPDFCQYKTQDVKVNTYNLELNPIDASVSYECFDQQCSLGETTQGTIKASAPACVNGYLIARAEGYADKKQLFSSNDEGEADMVLDREKELEVQVMVGGKLLSGKNAIVTFNSEDKSYSTALPDSNTIRLSEGLYNVSVYVYGNSSITVPAGTKTQCTEVPRDGLFGILGITKEQCFEIKIPQTTVDSALAGGGKSEVYVLDSDLKSKVIINVDEFPKPTTLEQLQNNYELYDAGVAEVSFA